MTEKILYDKHGLLIKKNQAKYESTLSFENNRVYLDKLFSIHFIYAMMKVNGDFIEESNIEISKDNTSARVYILVKHLYADIGTPQFYLYFNISMVRHDETHVDYLVQSIYEKPPNYDEDFELLDVVFSKVDLRFPSRHFCNIQHEISMKEVPDFVEKIMVMIYSKMFLNIKKFIDSASL